jgi:hypothetical protein
VLGDGRPAHRQSIRKLPDRAWPLGEALEDRPTGAIAEQIPHIAGVCIRSVSRHER